MRYCASYNCYMICDVSIKRKTYVQALYKQRAFYLKYKKWLITEYLHSGYKIVRAAKTGRQTGFNM